MENLGEPDAKRDPSADSTDEVPKIQPIRKPLNVTALSVGGLLALGLFYTFYFARDFFLPIALAWMIAMLLKPAVRVLKRIHIPEAVGAAVLLLALLSIFLSGTLLLSEPAAKWLERAPESLEKVEAKARSLMSSANSLTKAAEKVEELADNGDQTPQVEIKKPGLLSNLLSRTKGIAVLIVEVIILLYFFLAVGDVFTLKLVQVLPRLRDKKEALEIVNETQSSISQYLISITFINLIEGTAIGVGLAILGLPNPLLWGVLAFFANYIPYLGAIIAGSIVTLVALVTFDSIGQAMIAPLIYFGVNFTDNFLAPYIVGKRLVLNPVIVFLAVMFWGWLWGIPGVLVAVPLTMIIKIICDHNAVLAPFAEFLTAPRTETEKEPDPPVKPALAKGGV